MIIPPPDIKTVVDKTASYVAKNGQPFESMIMKVEANNPKFNFLRHEDDPYRPYYTQKLEEFSGTAQTPAEPVPDVTIEKPVEVLSAPVRRENEYQKQLRELIFGGDYQERKANGDLRPYQPDQFNIAHPALASVDSDIIKLTA